MNQYKILCEIRKDCKWHLRNALRGLWGGVMKSQVFLSGINGTEMMKELAVKDLREPMKQSTELIMCKFWGGYVKLSVG
jgi:hypothetical protein